MFSLAKVLTDIATKLVNVLHKADVVNNLTSTSTTKPLSANQGKVLNDKIPFSFGIDSNGNYGYKKQGETTIRPF